MKKIVKEHLFQTMALLLVVALAGLAGCGSPLQFQNQNSGMGKLVISVSASEARTLYPIGIENEIDSYVLSFEGASTVADVTLADGEQSKEVELAPGNWTITAKALIGTDEIAVGSKAVTVNPGQTSQVSIVLAPNASGRTGFFDYEITNLPVGATVELKIGNDTYTDDADIIELAAGQYVMLLKIQKDGLFTSGKAEALHIYAGLTTTMEFDVDGAEWKSPVFKGLDLSGIITAPVKDAAPNTDPIDAEQFTGSVVWSPADAVFAADTVYTATVTLTAKDGYTFLGIDEDAFSFDGATVSNDADSGIVTIVFPKTAAPDPVQIQITIGFAYGEIAISGSDGVNLIYKEGEPSGLNLSISGYDNVSWYVDGRAVGTGNSVTVNAASYNIGEHAVSFIGLLEGIILSQEVPFTVAASAAPLIQYGIWYETAFAEWEAASATDIFSAQTRLNDGAWVNVDTELVRKIDADNNIWRVDVLGLRNTPGSVYDLRILDADDAQVYLVTGLEAVPFDRQGYAFATNSPNNTFTTTTGGYNADGTVAANAQIVYVTHENMATTLVAGLYDNKTTNPIILRLIGQVGKLNFTSYQTLTNRTMLPPGANNTNRQYTIATSRNITIEGVGCDAYMEGWGWNLNNNSNIVVRNLRFDWWHEDAISLNASSNTSHAYSHSWIDHCIFGYGLDRFNNPYLTGEFDHVLGDGATDITNGATHWTVSYNQYRGSGKSSLVGGGTGAAIGHGTFHHNWFIATQERTPRVRNGWVHVFNNIYDHVGGEPGGGTGYGIGAGHRANIVAEGNTFIHAYRPFVISGGQSGIAAGPNGDGNRNTLSNDAPGVIVTSLYANALGVTGRDLVPNALDNWSLGLESPGANPWYFENELLLEDLVIDANNSFNSNGTIINNRRGSNANFGTTTRYTYRFVPFHVATNYRNDGTTGGTGAASPNLNFGVQPAINTTLSSLGVETAVDAEARVRAEAGVMPHPAWRPDTFVRAIQPTS